MVRFARPKIVIIRPSYKIRCFSTVHDQTQYVSIVLDRNKYKCARPKFGIFRQFSTKLSMFCSCSTETNVLNPSKICFDRAPPKRKLLDHTRIKEICFDRARPKLGMFQFSNHMRYLNLDVIFYAFRITSYHAFVSEWMIIVNWNLKAL